MEVKKYHRRRRKTETEKDHEDKKSLRFKRFCSVKCRVYWNRLAKKNPSLKKEFVESPEPPDWMKDPRNWKWDPKTKFWRRKPKIGHQLWLEK